MDAGDDLPMVSVIIAAFNYGKYLAAAIRSVQSQSYENVELIVVDDGSTDDTRDIVAGFEQVIYHYQENKGLSAARNSGINLCRGKYLLFLDADDWLEPGGIAGSVQVISLRPEMAFIFGNYYLFRQETNETTPVVSDPGADAYCSLLKGNCIGMLATVLFRRDVFRDLRFDESLKGCEDYDLYLKIARDRPVFHHNQFIATYYFHPASLSHNYPVMIRSLKEIMKRQESLLTSAEERRAYRKGKDQWKQYLPD